MNESRRDDRRRRGLTAVAALAVVAAGVSAPAVVAPSAALGPARGACAWTPDVLPVPDEAFHGRVTAGAGEWLAGVASADGANAAVRWRAGEVESLGPAFGLATTVAAVNSVGVVVGTATTPDGVQHAFRHRGGYERLPQTGRWATALDVNARGDVVGHDGARLVVWPAAGPPRFLDLPAGEAPYGRAAIDDDGTVAASTGHVAAGALRWRTYEWALDGTRVPRDVRDGRVLGTVDDPDGVPYLGGARAVAVNAEGTVVGASRTGDPLVWDGVLPSLLPTPARHTAGVVTALNASEAGGFAYPENGDGPVPVRWRCR